MTIQSMPPEILTHITDNLLDPKHRARLGATCRSLHDWSEKSPQWRRLVQKHFSHKWDALYATAPPTLNFARIYALETAVQSGSCRVSYALMQVSEDSETLTFLQRVVCVCLLPVKPIATFLLSELAGVRTILNSPEEDTR
jgi:F-box-like